MFLLTLLTIKAILTDIEGTTTSISFVHDVLFPYAKEHVEEYLITHSSEQSVSEVIEQVGQNLSQATQTLLEWMEQDKKITPLKTLQGMMWKEGYERGDFQGHVYLDAFEQLTKWKEEGFDLYVYSSGSVEAQKLLFSHSTYGDLTPLFSGYFDTKIGGKREAASYSRIAESLNLLPQEILFLSDTPEEISAASQAGFSTFHVQREETDFYSIKF